MAQYDGLKKPKKDKSKSGPEPDEKGPEKLPRDRKGRMPSHRML